MLMIQRKQKQNTVKLFILYHQFYKNMHTGDTKVSINNGIADDFSSGRQTKFLINAINIFAIAIAETDAIL